MGWLGLAIALAAALCAVLPAPGIFAGMGLGILALFLGATGYRDRQAPGAQRLGALAAALLGALALTISGLRYGAVLFAIREIERFF